MSFNHGLLLNCFAHIKFKLLNTVFFYAPITSNFHVYEAEKYSHRNEGIPKCTVTITEMFQR